MLQQALNRHSQIVIPPETKVFYSLIGHAKSCQARHLKRLENDLGISLPMPPKGICTQRDTREFFSLIAERYLHRLGRPHDTVFGEKTPEHSLCLKSLHEAFPAAKIIWIVRDGRDVATSLTRVPWMSRDAIANFFVWLFFYRLQLRCAAEVQGLHVVKYEDLVADPERHLRVLTDFLGLPYEPVMVSHHGNREGVPSREYAWKMSAFEPIAPHRIGAWKQALSPSEAALLERLGRTPLAALGYSLTAQGRQQLSFLDLARLATSASSLVLDLPLHSFCHRICGKLSCHKVFSRKLRDLWPLAKWPVQGRMRRSCIGTTR